MDILFVVPPFADLSRPAIGVSLLKAASAQRAYSCRIKYLNLALAELIGYSLYQSIANAFPSESLVGEWFFADAVFGDSIPEADEYVRKVLLRVAGAPEVTEQIVAARRQRHEFVETAVRTILAERPAIVGFTTTFHQTCSSLAIARGLKEAPNPPAIIFGGANCEGEMGLQMVRSFPWIDYVATGESDLTFPVLAESLLGKASHAPIPGIVTRDRGDGLTWPERVKDMDALPVPDYEDYFEQLEASSVRAEVRPDLLIETSRGCWWGAKQHCTFCGLNGDSMAFRSKSPEKAFDEISYLCHRYGLKRIDSVDNILDMRYVDTLFQRLADSGLEVEMFFEVKANLRYEQLKAMRAAGVQAIQPGIESFSNVILRLMKKGCSGVQNIQLLRWCAEMGVLVAWNILAGFPGESASDYREQEELVPLLTHLQPPASCTPVRLDRFSPLFNRAEEFGLVRLRPSPAYFYVFPLGRRDLSRLAYCFDFDYGDGHQPAEYIAGLRREVQQWWMLQQAEADSRPRLDAYCEGDRIDVLDTRPVRTAERHELSGFAAQVYLHCDAAHSISGLRRRLSGTASEQDIRVALEQLVAAKLMVEMEGQYLSLAVFRSRPRKEQVELDVFPETQKTQAAVSLLHLV